MAKIIIQNVNDHSRGLGNGERGGDRRADERRNEVKKGLNDGTALLIGFDENLKDYGKF